MTPELIITRSAGPSLSITVEKGLQIGAKDLWLGITGSLPGRGAPAPRSVAFSVVGGAANLLDFLGQRAVLYIDNTEAVSGQLTDLTSSSDGLLTGIIAPIDLSSARTIPAPSTAVSDMTFPRTAAVRDVAYSGAGTVYTDSNALGRYPAWIIGQPGIGVINYFAIVGSFTTNFPCAPALYAEANDTISVTPQTATDNIYVIAGHKMVSTAIGLVNLSLVGVSGSAGSIPAVTGQIEYAEDSLGHGFSYVRVADYTGFSTLLERGYSGGDYWSRMLPASLGFGEPGGLPNPFGLGALRSAGDVVRWAAGESGIEYDPSKIALLEAFSEYYIDTYIDQPTNLYDWVSAEVIPLLPACAAVGPRGLYLAPLSRDTIEVPAGSVEIVGQIQTDTSQIVNKFDFSFAPNPQSAKSPYAGRVAVGGADRPDPDCDRSQRTWGVRTEGLETTAVFDATTAARMLAWRPTVYANPLISAVFLWHGKAAANAPEIGQKMTIYAAPIQRTITGWVVGWRDYGQGWLEIEIVAPAR